MSKLIDGLISVCIEIKDRCLSLGQETVPVNYYTLHNNWGDQLNKYLIEKITGKKVVKNNFKHFPHILAIGSVLSSASEKSISWGSGFISSDAKLRTDKLDIRAVRGLLTQDRLVSEFTIKCPSIMGDPAVLLKSFYNPTGIVKCNKVGIIAHYKDKELPVVKALFEKGCVLVDIQNDIEPFIDAVNSCEYILSSSLHGLIAADTYGIPNLWVSFGDNVLGGSYKFMDYYSTTTLLEPKPYKLSLETEIDIEALTRKCEISDYIFDRNALFEAFPRDI